MKKIILLPAFMFCMAAGLWAEDDCAKSADACKPQIRKITPFMAEIKKAGKPLELKQGVAQETTLKQGAAKETALKQGVAKGQALKQGDPKPQFVSKLGPAGDAPVVPPAQKEALSKPAWLLAVGALLAGLYYFLKEGKSKRKRS
jgi:hypothetical protein